jgi:hypothetical protein
MTEWLHIHVPPSERKRNAAPVLLPERAALKAEPLPETREERLLVKRLREAHRQTTRDRRVRGNRERATRRSETR